MFRLTTASAALVISVTLATVAATVAFAQTASPLPAAAVATSSESVTNNSGTSVLVKGVRTLQKAAIKYMVAEDLTVLALKAGVGTPKGQQMLARAASMRSSGDALREKAQELKAEAGLQHFNMAQRLLRANKVPVESAEWKKAALQFDKLELLIENLPTPG